MKQNVFLILAPLAMIFLFFFFYEWEEEGRRRLKREEGMENQSSSSPPPLLVLLGDSTIDNVNYVPNKASSIPSLLSQKGKKKKYNDVLIMAKDNAIIQDCFQQWNQALEQMKKNNHNSPNKIIIVLSVGGNNLLQLLQEDPYTGDKLASQHIPQLLQEYDTLVKKIRQDSSQHSSHDFSSFSFVICNLYFPPTLQRFHPLIEEWNEKLFAMTRTWSSNEKEVMYFHYDQVMTTVQDFTHEIEPSKEGGNKFVNALLDILS